MTAAQCIEVGCKAARSGPATLGLLAFFFISIAAVAGLIYLLAAEIRKTRTQ